jgi:ADP-dependent NAD(P)H-hydrate dehydratase / NAD(P)H-hydrate epimerase
MKVVTVTEMKAIEKEADQGGLTYSEMMEFAGQGLAEVIQDLQIDTTDREIIGLVGSGNNGGDTLVALAHLVADGWVVRAYLVGRKKDALVKRLEEGGGQILSIDEDGQFKSLAAFVESAAIVLDGLLGTGIKLPLKDEFAQVLAAAQGILYGLEEPPLVIAVDCPSGTDCDTGEAAPECLHADLTVTMGAVKQGLLKLPAYEFIGNLEVVDIGLPDNLASEKNLQTSVAEEEMVAGLLPERPLGAHKGTFGTALIVAGSINYTGAALLAGEAAYRIGAGLVTLAVPSPLHAALAGQFPEATWVLLPHEVGVISSNAAGVLAKNLEHTTALLVGPGFGLEQTTKQFIENLLIGSSSSRRGAGRIGFVREEADQKQPTGGDKLPAVVFDADGLKLLAEIKDWPRLLPAPAVLTPHPGEMSVLTGLTVDEIQKDRLAIARRFAKEWGHVVVLKGAFTVIAAPEGPATIIPVASPALAHAGTGDVLAGLIVGLRAQGLGAYEAAVAGAWIHAQAGLYAAEDLGTTASVLSRDILNSVSDVLGDL